MSFAYAAGVITQTGTDTDLSGLSGLTGVTVTDHGWYTEYDTGTNRLLVEGSLTVSGATREQLRYQGDILYDDNNFEITGTLIIGKLEADVRDYNMQYNIPSIVEVSAITSSAISNGANGEGSTGARSSFYINGGTVKSYGRIVNVNSIGVEVGSTFHIFNSKWTKHNFSYIYTDDLRIVDSDFCWFVWGMSNPTEIEGMILAPVPNVGETYGYFNGSSTLADNVEVYISNVPDLNGAYIYAYGKSTTIAASPHAIFTNLETGTAQFYHVNAGREGQVTLKRSIEYLTQDINGNPITTAKVWRQGSVGTEAAFAVDGSGLYAEDYTFAYRYADNGSWQAYTFYTTNADETDDLIDIKAVDYLSIISDQSGTSLRGLLVKRVTLILPVDTAITESIKSTVDAYATLDDIYKTYDALKSDLCDNYLGENTTIISRNDTQVICGSRGLTIDASAASVRAYTGSLVTIKSSAFTGGYKGTGTVNQLNGATITDLVLSGGATWNTVQSTWTGSATAADTIDVATAGSYDATGFTFNAASTINNSSGGTVNVHLSIGGTQPLTTGGTVVFSVPQLTAQVTNIIAGSRIQVYNITTASEEANEIVAGTTWSLNYDEGVEFTAGDEIRIRLTCQSGTTACQQYQATALATSSGWSAFASQKTIPAYATIGIDGSTVTEYALDAGSLYADANDADGVSQKKRLVAWFYYALTTETGIRNFFGAIVLEDEANAYIDTATVNLKLDNISTRQLLLDDSDFRLYTLDGSDFVLYPSTGGYGVTFSSGKVYVGQPPNAISAASIKRSVRQVLRSKDTNSTINLKK